MLQAASLLRNAPHTSLFSTPALHRHHQLLSAIQQDCAGASRLIDHVAQDVNLAAKDCSQPEEAISFVAYPLLLVLMTCETVTTGTSFPAQCEMLSLFAPIFLAVHASCLTACATQQDFQICSQLLSNVLSPLPSAVNQFVQVGDDQDKQQQQPPLVVLATLHHWETQLRPRYKSIIRETLTATLQAAMKYSGAENHRADRDKFARALNVLQLMVPLSPLFCAMVLTVLTKIVLRANTKLGLPSAKKTYEIYLMWLNGHRDSVSQGVDESSEFLLVSFKLMLTAPKIGFKDSSGSDYTESFELFMLTLFTQHNFLDIGALRDWSNIEQLTLLHLFLSATARAPYSFNFSRQEDLSALAREHFVRLVTCNNSDQRDYFLSNSFVSLYLRQLCDSKSASIFVRNNLPSLLEFGVTLEESTPNEEIWPDSDDLRAGLEVLLYRGHKNAQELVGDLLALLVGDVSSHGRPTFSQSLVGVCYSHGLVQELIAQMALRVGDDSSHLLRSTLWFCLRCIKGLIGLVVDHAVFVEAQDLFFMLNGRKLAHIRKEALLLQCVILAYIEEKAGRRFYADHLRDWLVAFRTKDSFQQSLCRAVLHTAALAWNVNPDSVMKSFWEIIAEHVKRSAESTDHENRYNLDTLLKSAEFRDIFPSPALCGMARHVVSLLREEDRIDLHLLQLLREVLHKIISISEEAKSADDENAFAAERRVADLTLAITQGLATTHSGYPDIVEVGMECVLEALTIHKTCPRSLYSRIKQTWIGICAGVQYPTATYRSVELCLKIVQTVCLDFAADFTFAIIRVNFLPAVLTFLRQCSTSEIRNEDKVFKLATSLIDLLRCLSTSSNACGKGMLALISESELQELQHRWSHQRAFEQIEEDVDCKHT